MGTNGSEKLSRCELKGNIWLLERVYSYDVVLCLCCFYIGAPILYVHMQVRFIHGKVFASHIDNCGIDLYSINRHWSVNTGKLVGNCACREANDTDAM